MSDTSLSLLTANSDDPTTNIFAPAYVRPVRVVVDPRDNSFFQANSFGSSPNNIRAFFTDRDLTNTDTDIEFWTVFILGAYQHTLVGDRDPSTQTGLFFGIVDAVTNVTGEGSGALIFLESHSSKEITVFSAPANLRRINVTVGHEVGHLFSGEHGDGGIMGIILPNGSTYLTSDQFDPVTINKIRELPHP